MDERSEVYEGYGLPVQSSDVATASPLPTAPQAAGRRRTWLILMAVLVVVVIVLIGLWLWLRSTPLGIVAQAVTTTLKQETAETQVSSTVGGVPLLGEVDLLVADGEVDFTTGDARFRREIFGGVATELRYVDDGVFLQVPLTTDRWVRLADNSATVDSLSTDVTSLVPGLGNPLTLLGLLRTLDTTPTRVGEEDISGTTTTVYEVIVDLDEAAGLMDAEAGEAIRNLRQLTGGGRLPLRIAIDEDNLIRRVEFATRLRLTDAIAPELENRIIFTGFGNDVDVAAPSADQLVELDTDALARLDPLSAIRDLLGSVS